MVYTYSKIPVQEFPMNFEGKMLNGIGVYNELCSLLAIKTLKNPE